MKNKDKIIGYFALAVQYILFAVFLVLKLAKIINWSWLWVLSPIWISVSSKSLIVIICIIIYYYGKD